MRYPIANVDEIEEVASIISPFDTVRATVGPWVAGFGGHGTRLGHNVIWVWSEIDAFPARRFEQRRRHQRVAALRRFIAQLTAGGTLP